MNEVLQRVWGRFLQADLTVGRIVVSIASMLWAAILLLMGEQFDRSHYVYMREIAPQWAWGLVFGLVGVLQFAWAIMGVPLTQGFYTCTISGVIAWLWCFVAAMLWMAITPPPAIVAGNVAIAILAGLIFIRTVSRRE